MSRAQVAQVDPGKRCHGHGHGMMRDSSQTVGQGKCWGNHGTTFVWNPVGTNYVAESRAEGSNLLVSHRRKEGTHNMYILYVCIHIYIYTYTYTYAYAHNMMQQSFWVFRHLPSILGVIPRLLSTIGNRTTGWGDFPASPGRTTYPVVLCLHPIMSLLFAQICHIYHHFSGWKHVETIRGFHSHRCDEALQIVWVFIGLPALRDWAMINTTHTLPHEEFQHQTEVKQR